jgi:arsenate reductase
MAEGLWRNLAGAEWDVFSAGVAPIGVSPLAVRAMAEIGIDISAQRSQIMSEFVDQPFDLVVTVCSNAEQKCPNFPNAAARAHWPFEDPYYASGGDEEIMREFGRVRDQIAGAIRSFLSSQPRLDTTS